MSKAGLGGRVFATSAPPKAFGSVIVFEADCADGAIGVRRMRVGIDMIGTPDDHSRLGYRDSSRPLLAAITPRSGERAGLQRKRGAELVG